MAKATLTVLVVSALPVPVCLPGEEGCLVDLFDEVTRGGDGDDDDDDEEEEVGDGDDEDSDIDDELEHEDELKRGGEGVVLGDMDTLLPLDLTNGRALTVVGGGGGAFIESHRSSSCFRLSLAFSLSIWTSFLSAFSYELPLTVAEVPPLLVPLMSSVGPPPPPCPLLLCRRPAGLKWIASLSSSIIPLRQVVKKLYKNESKQHQQQRLVLRSTTGEREQEKNLADLGNGQSCGHIWVGRLLVLLPIFYHNI